MLRKEEQTEDIEEQRITAVEQALAKLTVAVDRIVEYARENDGLETKEAKG